MSRWPIIFLIASILTAVTGLTEIADSLGNTIMILFLASTVSFIFSLVIREIALTKRFNKDKQNYLNTLK